MSQFALSAQAEVFRADTQVANKKSIDPAAIFFLRLKIDDTLFVDLLNKKSFYVQNSIIPTMNSEAEKNHRDKNKNEIGDKKISSQILLSFSWF